MISRPPKSLPHRIGHPLISQQPAASSLSVMLRCSRPPLLPLISALPYSVLRRPPPDQHPTLNLQLATCNLQPTLNLQLATCNLQPTFNLQPLPCNLQVRPKPGRDCSPAGVTITRSFAMRAAASKPIFSGTPNWTFGAIAQACIRRTPS